MLKSGRKQRNVIKAMGSQARTAGAGRGLCGHQPAPPRTLPAPARRGPARGTWPGRETTFEVPAPAPKPRAPSSPDPSPGHPAKAGGLSRSTRGGRPPRAPISPSDRRFSSSPIAAFGRLFLAPVISLRPTFPSHLIPFSAFLVATSLLRDASSSRSALHLPPPRSQPRGDGAARAQRGAGDGEGAEAAGAAARPGLSWAASGEGLLGQDLGSSPNTAEGALRWRRAGGAGNPLAAPQRAGLPPVALLPAAGWGLAGARGAEGTPILPLLPRARRPPSSGPRLRRWALLHPKVGSGEAAERSHASPWGGTAMPAWRRGGRQPLVPPRAPLPPSLPRPMGTGARGGFLPPQCYFFFEAGCDTRVNGF